MTLTGVLLAAGRSRRMGRTKQLLPWPPPDGATTIIAASFDSIHEACDDVVVVVGHEVDAVTAALGDRPFHAVHADPDTPMFESLRAGLGIACERNPATDVLVHPGDVPAVNPATVRALVAAGSPQHALIPTHDGRGGHPLLLPHALIGDVLTYSGDGGLREWCRRNPDASRRLPVDDAGIVADVDRPEDYD